MKSRAEVREWALRNGFEVSTLGPLPKRVVTAYAQWLASATPAEIEQLTRWADQRREDWQQAQLALAQGAGLQQPAVVTFQEIMHKIRLFEQRNTRLRIDLVVRYISQI